MSFFSSFSHAYNNSERARSAIEANRARDVANAALTDIEYWKKRALRAEAEIKGLEAVSAAYANALDDSHALRQLTGRNRPNGKPERQIHTIFDTAYTAAAVALGLAKKRS